MPRLAVAAKPAQTVQTLNLLDGLAKAGWVRRKCEIELTEILNLLTNFRPVSSIDARTFAYRSKIRDFSAHDCESCR